MGRLHAELDDYVLAGRQFDEVGIGQLHIVALINRVMNGGQH